MKPFDDVLNIKITLPSYPYPDPYPIADMGGSGQETTGCKQFPESKPPPNLHWSVDQPIPHSPSLRANEIRQAPSSDEENDTFDSSSAAATVALAQSHRVRPAHSDPQVSTVPHDEPATQREQPLYVDASLDAGATTDSSVQQDQSECRNTVAVTVNERSSRQALHLQSASRARDDLSSPNAGVSPPNEEKNDNKNDAELSDPDSESTDTDGDSSVASRGGVIQSRHVISNSSPRNQDSTHQEQLSDQQLEACSTTPARDLTSTDKKKRETLSPRPVINVQESDDQAILERAENRDDSIQSSRVDVAEMKSSSMEDDSEDHESSTFIPWTMDQHRAFVSAVFEIGLKHCSPSVIMDTMKNLPSDMSREKTKSHLQKFRKTSERSLEEFIGEYDDFMKIIQNQDSPSAHDIEGHQVEDSQNEEKQEAAEARPSKKPTSEEASALLRAALAGKDPDKLLGGTAAAYAAFSVAHNCPIKDRSNAIPYEPSPEDFPILSDAESKSSLGQSLMKVKGALEFMTEFILKARHGIPMKLDKKLPPFLKREDIATALPQHFSSSTDGGSEAIPDRMNSIHQRPRSVDQSMHGMDPAFSVSYPSHPVYPAQQPPYMAGYAHNTMASHTVGYGSVPPPSTMYPHGGHHPQNMWQHFMPPSHVGQPPFLPPTHEPPTLASFYPPPTLHPPPPVGGPPDQSYHGRHMSYHNGPPGYDYSGGHTALHHAIPLPSVHSDFHSSSYMPEQHDSNVNSMMHQAHGVPSYPVESPDHEAAASPTNPSKRREKSRRYNDDHSPVRRTIFDMVSPEKTHKSKREKKESEKFPTDSRSRSEAPPHGSSRHYYETTMLSSPIHRPTNSSRKKRSWSPSPNEEKRPSTKSRSDIFRIEVPTCRRPEGMVELERPSSTLSFNIDDLGLRPTDGTPMSNDTSSPVTTVLRDMLWNPIGADSSDLDHITGDREERSQPRSRRNIFSLGISTTGRNSDSRHSLSESAENRADHTRNTVSTDDQIDQVALDFGINVPHPDNEDDHP